jgi:hypothetical protein
MSTTNRARQRGKQRVDALGLRIAVPGALFGVAVGRLDGVIDVQVRDLIGRGQQRGALSELDEHGCDERVEPTNMPEREGAQESGEHRRRPQPTKQPAHRAMAQQIHLVDAVRAGEHPCHQRRHLQPGIR